MATAPPIAVIPVRGRVHLPWPRGSSLVVNLCAIMVAACVAPELVAAPDRDIPRSFYDTGGRGGRVVFFPPNPPPLGLELIITPAGDPEIGAPSGAEHFVNEPFYAPLATLMAERALDPDMAAEIARYLRERQEAEAGLVEHLARVAGSDPHDRRMALGAFAVRQSPQLVRLEQQAQSIRERLVGGRLLTDDGANWNAMRRWRLGRETLRDQRDRFIAFEYQVMKAAPFFQDGLSAAQRRLLREIVISLEAEAFHLEPPGGSRFVFFLPEGVRIEIPDGLPPVLAGQVGAFLAGKAGLRRELRDAIYEADRAFLEFSRVRQLHECALRQEEKFLALEEAAEAIRVAFDDAGLIERRPAPAPLPPRMEVLIDTYEKERAQLELELEERILRQVRDEIPAYFSSKMEARSRPYKWFKIRQRVEPQFREENRARYERLERLLEDFHAEMTELADSDARAIAIAAGVRDLGWEVEDFLQARRKLEGLHLYDVAAFEPGLSPEQRRLLFDGAIARLGLPLPEGQPQPMNLPRTVAQ